jgi:hypothetical protein
MKNVVDQIGHLLRERYVFEEEGEKLADWLDMHYSQGAFEGITDPSTFAHAVTELLIPHDQHLLLRYDPNPLEPMQRHQARANLSNWGFNGVKRLEGNIGYIDLRELPPLEIAGAIAEGAMSFVSYMNAIILDCRFVTGGAPDMIQFIASYFFDDEPRPLSGVFWRTSNTTIKLTTLPQLPGTRMPDVPLYVLASGATFSGGEALVYDLQALDRATIVGETTRGGAHLSSHHQIKGGFEFRLPHARAVNPITGTNWERVGVQPNIEVRHNEALLTAHLLALDLLEDSQPEFIRWERENLRVRLEPYVPDLPERYVGQYGDRKIAFKDGQLVHRLYTERPLISLDSKTFLLDDLTRIHFEHNALVVIERSGVQIRIEREKD